MEIWLCLEEAEEASLIPAKERTPVGRLRRWMVKEPVTCVVTVLLVLLVRRGSIPATKRRRLTLLEIVLLFCRRQPSVDSIMNAQWKGKKGKPIRRKQYLCIPRNTYSYALHSPVELLKDVKNDDGQ